MTTFYLVRHAHADWTPDEDRPLSARGRADAERVADLLQPFPITAVCASPCRRARETVEPLAARLDLPIRELPDLRERQLAAGAVDDFLDAVAATWRDPAFAHPGGEANAVAQKRGVAVVRRLQEQHPAGHIVLGTHGNLLALVLQHFDPAVDFAFWQALTMPDIYQLTLSGAVAAAVRRIWKEPDPLEVQNAHSSDLSPL